MTTFLMLAFPICLVWCLVQISAWARSAWSRRTLMLRRAAVDQELEAMRHEQSLKAAAILPFPGSRRVS